MPETRPVFCRQQAFDLFASQLPALETGRGLLTAAVAISMHELPEADPLAVEAGTRELADRVRARVRGRQPQAILAHAHEVLFEEEGFTGNAEDYYNPVNSYLPVVLKTRQGLPITLTLLYKSVLERLGLRVHGVGAPWHFLAGVELDGNGPPAGAAPAAAALMLVDTFHGGRTVTPEEVARRIEGAAGTPVASPRDVLPVTTHRQWLTRMLYNLQNSFTHLNQRENLGAMAELRALLDRDVPAAA